MKDHAILQYYGMLVHVSAGYLPVRGWLHTCYSPVRRSPPVYCYTVLPLDLHVLSLSLAFILSQDQTLHCKSIVIYPIRGDISSVQDVENLLTVIFTYLYNKY